MKKTLREGTHHFMAALETPSVCTPDNIRGRLARMSKDVHEIQQQIAVWSAAGADATHDPAEHDEVRVPIENLVTQRFAAMQREAGKLLDAVRRLQRGVQDIERSSADIRSAATKVMDGSDQEVSG